MAWLLIRLIEDVVVYLRHVLLRHSEYWFAVRLDQLD